MAARAGSSPVRAFGLCAGHWWRRSNRVDVMRRGVDYADEVAGVVRNAGPDDWPAICGVFAEAGKAGWSHIIPAPLLADLTASKGWHPAYRANVLVAEVEGELVGFTVIQASQDSDASPEVGEIDAFYTHPTVWGHGVGRVLIAGALKRLAELGFKEATLWTEHRNDRPRRFYELAGWKLDGARRRKEYRGIELLEVRYRINMRSQSARLV